MSLLAKPFVAAMTILAQAEDDGPGVLDNEFLDEWEIPFGAWVDQAVDWIDNNLEPLLDAIEWPFDFLIGLVVTDFLVPISWLWVVLGMGLLAALIRNVKVGVFVALALTVCGMLGNAYWIETARTIGFILVAVVLCVMIGIPIGIACGRVDGVWKVTRPVLDAMQVVHSFVYMLPFIFFWGIGEVSATMVTMIFAIPPLIRLTNLGIRQVPDDVVEAARAQGAPEWRVLFDVQLPLARPAIMTGINQTLLLAISMLGIAAIMGAGGLGRLLFRALSNQDVALAASAGLAFFLVAVVLDRMSQREDGDGGNLFQRIWGAWAHLRDPEALLPEEGPVAVAAARPEERFEPISGRERLAMIVTAVGGAVLAISVFLPWTENAGKISAYGNRDDEDLPGMVFNGLEAAGGSFFGIVVLVLGLFVALAAIVTYVWPGRAARWLAADGAAIGALGAFLTAFAFFFAEPPNLAVDPGTGTGVWVAMLGGLVAVVGSVLWLRAGPYDPLHPLRVNIAWGRLIGVAIAIVILVIGAFSAWTFDGRADVIIPPELQAEIDRLAQVAAENPADATVIANDIANLINAAQATSAIVIDGVSSDGARLGILTVVLGLLAGLTTLPSAGIFGRSERQMWLWASVTAGLGMGIFLIAFAWIFVFVRNGDANFVSGIGSFLAMAGGLFVAASAMPILKEFRRAKVYDDEAVAGTAGDAEAETEAVEELV